MRRSFLRDNGLSLFFGGLFLAATAGQSVAGHAAYNEQQLQHEDETISCGRYVLSSDFGQALLENWQSEYLQFAGSSRSYAGPGPSCRRRQAASSVSACSRTRVGLFGDLVLTA